MTVRGDGVLPKIFTGGAGDLDKLTTQAAEYIYGQSQPGLYATYLRNAGRDAEAMAFAKAAYATSSAEDRALSAEHLGHCAAEPAALRTAEPGRSSERPCG